MDYIYRYVLCMFVTNSNGAQDIVWHLERARSTNRFDGAERMCVADVGRRIVGIYIYMYNEVKHLLRFILIDWPA